MKLTIKENAARILSKKLATDQFLRVEFQPEQFPGDQGRQVHH